MRSAEGSELWGLQTVASRRSLAGSPLLRKAAVLIRSNVVTVASQAHPSISSSHRMGKGGVSSTHEHHDYVSCCLRTSVAPASMTERSLRCPALRSSFLCHQHSCRLRHLSRFQPCSCLQLRKHKFPVPVKREVRTVGPQTPLSRPCCNPLPNVHYNTASFHHCLIACPAQQPHC